MPWPLRELGRGMAHQIRAEIDGFAEIRRSEGRVNEQRQVGVVGDLRHGGDVEHFETRIAEDFAEHQPRVVANRRTECRWRPRVDEGRFDAETGQRVLQQVVGSAVERT